MKAHLAPWLAGAAIVFAVSWAAGTDFEDAQTSAEHTAETIQQEHQRQLDERTAAALIDASRAEFKRMQADGRAESPGHFSYPVGDVVVYRNPN